MGTDVAISAPSVLQEEWCKWLQFSAKSGFLWGRPRSPQRERGNWQQRGVWRRVTLVMCTPAPWQGQRETGGMMSWVKCGGKPCSSSSFYTKCETMWCDWTILLFLIVFSQLIERVSLQRGNLQNSFTNSPEKNPTPPFVAAWWPA